MEKENFEEVVEEVVEETKEKVDAVENAISKSKQKRLEKQKKAAQKKRQTIISKVIWIAIGVVIAGAVIAAISIAVVKKMNEITPSNDYSAELNDNGFIKGVTATDYVDIPDYKNMNVPLDELQFTDEDVQADIETQLDTYKTLNTTSGTVADKDTVNIDYVGTIDGVEFEGGNSNGEGSDLEIGSGTFVDDFEQQLIGKNVGDDVTVEVTFPEDYNAAELAGKDASFAVKINGIYELGEFNDEFVKEHLSDRASTVEEYKQYLKDTNFNDNLENWITDYLVNNTTVKKYPKKYLHNLQCTRRYQDNESYEQMQQIYKQYYGSELGSFEDYTGKTEEEYLASLLEETQNEVKKNLINQAILEKEGVEATEADYRDYLKEVSGSDEQFDTMVEEFGEGYAMLSSVARKATNILTDYALNK